MNLRTELRALIALALPVSLAQLAIVGMSATDVLVAGRAGTVELAGMNLGVNAWNLIMLFFMGIGFATQPLIARRFGANDETGLKHQLHQSIWLGITLGVICMLLVWLAAAALDWLPFDAELTRIAKGYLYVISLCAIPMTLLPALRGTLEGLSLTVPVMVVNFCAFLLNIPLDIVLVHGLYGFPELGAIGCAWATVVVVVLMVVGNFLVLKYHRATRTRQLLSQFQAWHADTVRSTFKLGLPIGISIIVELSMFSGAGLMIAYFGAVETGAHAVAITVASASFMFYMGLGQGVTIRASQMLGANNAKHARYSIKVGTLFNCSLALVIGLVFVANPEFWAGLFSSDSAVIELGAVLLIFGAVFQLGDSLQVAIICALRAYHDTTSPLKYQIISFWLIGVPLGIALAFFDLWPGLSGAKGMWFAMAISLYLVAALLLIRLLRVMRQPLTIS